MKRFAFLLFPLLVLAALQSAIANTNGTPNSSEHTFASPEHTWALFKNAILEEDFDTAKQCFCYGKTKGVLKFQRMDAEKRKKIVQSMGQIEKIDEHEKKATYKLPRISNGATFYTYVNFEKVENEWKIESF